MYLFGENIRYIYRDESTKSFREITSQTTSQIHSAIKEPLFSNSHNLNPVMSISTFIIAELLSVVCIQVLHQGDHNRSIKKIKTTTVVCLLIIYSVQIRQQIIFIKRICTYLVLPTLLAHKKVHLETSEFPCSSQQLKYNFHYICLSLTMKKKTVFFSFW